MTSTRPSSSRRRVIALDGNRLGQIMGAIVATGVMIACFYQEADWTTVATRVGWTFVAVYAVTYLLARVILRTTLFEMIEQKRARKEAMRARSRQAATPPSGETASERPATIAESGERH